jgi:hypothetical protein
MGFSESRCLMPPRVSIFWINSIKPIETRAMINSYLFKWRPYKLLKDIWIPAALPNPVNKWVTI